MFICLSTYCHSDTITYAILAGLVFYLSKCGALQCSVKGKEDCTFYESDSVSHELVGIHI